MEAAEQQRAEMRERWERQAAGWRRQADGVREFGMPVSAWLIDHLHLQPGQVVVDLAAGPGDTGFMAAELTRPGGRLISSDASEAMLEVARERASAQGVENVEFRRLELEWIDLETASADAVVCRWGVMFAPDPGAALQEIRRVLRPSGRLALATWDGPMHNPWAAVPTLTLIELGHIEPPDPTAPGMFALADRARLQELLESAGFTDVLVEEVELQNPARDIERFLSDQADLNPMLGELKERLAPEELDAALAKIGERMAPFVSDGVLRLPGRALAAAATA